MISQLETIKQLLNILYDLDNKLEIVENRNLDSPLQLNDKILQEVNGWLSSLSSTTDTEPEKSLVPTEQLAAAGVKNILSELDKLEEECIDKIHYFNNDSAQQLSDEQWKVLASLHLQLLDKHLGFYDIVQLPSANLDIQQLDSEHNMLKRIWQHGISSILELLAQKLPASLEHMRTFYYNVNSIMGVLIMTTPSFKSNWEKYIKDLKKYNM